MLSEKQSERFIELAVRNNVLRAAPTLTCLKCGARNIGRWHKLACWLRWLRL